MERGVYAFAGIEKAFGKKQVLRGAGGSGAHAVFIDKRLQLFRFFEVRFVLFLFPCDFIRFQLLVRRVIAFEQA